MSSLTVATWNTAGRAEPDMLRLVAGLAPDVLLLQEVKAGTWEPWRDLEGWTGTAFGLDLRPRQPDEGGVRGLGAAVLVRTEGGLLESAVVLEEGIAQPERVVTATIAAPCCGDPVRLLAYHALNGRKGDDGLDKPRTTMTVGTWLAAQTGPVVAGMDANSPDIDHPDEQQMVCHFNGEPTRHMERTLLGPERAHRLSDVWRTYLAEHPSSSLLRHQPSGPLAVTHFTGGSRARYPVRYDHIWATPDFTVQDVRHLHEGFTAGSDHALVLATLEHHHTPPTTEDDASVGTDTGASS